MIHLLLSVIYLSFISLGLPDAVLGAAWPVMHQELNASVSSMGVLSFIICFGTILSSLQSDRLTRRFGTGRVMVASVATTALALLGFSFTGSFWGLCLLAVPYGLGAGCVDAALNNYVALHYASRHMSWLHCMWGVGASVGPYIMGNILSGGGTWHQGFRTVGVLQVGLMVVLFLSLPLWKGRDQDGAGEEQQGEALRLGQIFRILGAKEVMTAFFCYCALETTAGQWASSYLVMKDGLPPHEAAGFASLFYMGITAGRMLSGFLTMRFSDKQMIRMGQALMALGAAAMLLPFGKYATIPGLLLLGLGCAPVYPCIIHSTPAHFGAEQSQAVIGVQMASAYLGCLLMPPLYGLLAQYVTASLYPWCLTAVLGLMIVMSERLNLVKGNGDQ